MGRSFNFLSLWFLNKWSNTWSNPTGSSSTTCWVMKRLNSCIRPRCNNKTWSKSWNGVRLVSSWFSLRIELKGKRTSSLDIVVHLYLHSHERILVLTACLVGKRHRMVSNIGSGSVLIISKDDRLLCNDFRCVLVGFNAAKSQNQIEEIIREFTKFGSKLHVANRQVWVSKPWIASNYIVIVLWTYLKINTIWIKEIIYRKKYLIWK